MRLLGPAIFFVLVAACGARSELIAPDVGVDAVDITLPPDARADTGPDVVIGQPPIDTTCPGTCPYLGLRSVFPPFVPLARPDVPSYCSNGFELGGATGGCGRSTYTLVSTRAGGARAITLDVDFATYLVPDGVTLTGIDGSGNTYALLLTCRMQTSLVGGPSTMRPPNDTIRQFRVAVREGTSRLNFDFGAVTSPMYIQVLGLCDFALPRYPNAAWWQSVP
jgi:hypothetical protein